MNGRGFAPTWFLRTPQAGGSVTAPRAIPSFKPVPFKRDKFLSIKTRTAETFFGSRDRLLKRSATIAERIADTAKRVGASSPFATGSSTDTLSGSLRSSDDGGIHIGAPLTPHMTDEISAWNRSLLGLESMQGFVLTDELVYKAVCRNIRMGAYPHALSWLEKAARENRLPVPTPVLRDLRNLIGFVLSVLPASNATFATAIDMLLGEPCSVASLRMSTKRSHFVESNGSCSYEDAGMSSSLHLVNTTPYVLHTFRELYLPIWECLLRFGLLPTLLPNKDGKHHLERGEISEAVVMDLTRRIGFDVYATRNSGSLGSDAGNILSARQAYAELLLSLAQCAAEAKEVNILLHLQSTFCALFVESREASGSQSLAPGDGSAPRLWGLRRGAWCCNADGGGEWLDRFANDFLSSVYYGRLAHQSEMSLRNCVQCLVDATTNENGTEDRGSLTDGEERDENVDGEEGLPRDVGGCVDKASGPCLRRDTVEDVVWWMMECEPSLFPDAVTYASILLQRTRGGTIKLATEASTRFSLAELEWMQLHGNICRRSDAGESVAAELLDLIGPDGFVARELKSGASSLEDQQCLLGLVVDSVLYVVGTGQLSHPQRSELIIKSAAELLQRTGDATCQNGQRLTLPQYSVGCIMTCLVPLLGFVRGCASTLFDENNGREKGVNVPFSNEDVLGVVKGLLPSILEERVVFGNVYSSVVTVLALAEMWEEVMQILKHLDKPQKTDGETEGEEGICSVVIDQRVWAWLFRRARDAGQVEICLFLRDQREKLFY